MLSLARGVVLANALALVVAGSAGAAAHSLRTAAAVPDFGPNVKIFDPSMSTSEIKATVDAIAAQQVVEPVRDAALRVAVHARHVRLRRRPPQLPGRLLHRGRRSRQLAERRHRERHDRRLQPVLRPDDCTALVNFWRSLSNLTINVAGKSGCQFAGVLGDLAGRTDEARPRQRLHDADGLLHRPVVRERRLHRRLAVLRQHRRQRLAAAVPGPEQQRRRLDERRLEPGLRRRRRAHRAQSFPSPPYTTLATNPASREKPFLYVDANERLQRLRPRRAVQLVGHDVGERPDARPLDPDRGLLHREADRQRPVDQQRALARQEPDLHAGRLRRRQDDQGEARRHDRARARHGDAHGARTASSR